jgi:hypothetical protein
MISLNCEFYEFSFSLDYDVRASLEMETVNLKTGLLRPSKWSIDFNKYYNNWTCHMSTG